MKLSQSDKSHRQEYHTMKKFIRTPITSANSVELPIKYVRKIDKVATDLSQLINYLRYSNLSYINEEDADVLERAADIHAGLYEEHV